VNAGALGILLVLGIPFLIFAIAVVAIIGHFCVERLKVLMGRPSRRSKKQQAEEASMIQTMYRRLSKMEQRIEALETILMEQEREGGDK